MTNVFQSLYATAMSIKDTRDNQRMNILNRDLGNIHYSLEVWDGCSHVYTYNAFLYCNRIQYRVCITVPLRLLSFCLY